MMDPDLFPVESVMRMWGAISLALVAGVVGGALLLSHALKFLAQRHSAAHQPAAAPNLVPMLPSSRTENRLAVVGSHRSHLAFNAPIFGVGGRDEKKEGGS